MADDVGKGVFWEGTLIYSELYDAKGNPRCVPLLLDGAAYLKKEGFAIIEWLKKIWALPEPPTIGVIVFNMKQASFKVVFALI